MITSNPDFELAFHIIERTGTNLFLTGRAGTGKTTFLRSLIQKTSKRMIVAAPTGIAAINAGGVTLHSLFQLDFGPFIPGLKRKTIKFNQDKLKLIKHMDVLVIDEISMVRADLLDAVDSALRRLRNPHIPFGGVQLLLIGDLRQLPPVVTEEEKTILSSRYSTPYFFSSHALGMTQYVTIELQKVYRQENPEFVNLLNSVRDGHPSPQTITALNTRFIPNFTPNETESWIRLTTHNASATAINIKRLAALSSPSHKYKASVSGNFPEIAYPADKVLELKKGAQVMFIKNDPGPDKLFFNGMLGTVTELHDNAVLVKPSNGKPEITVTALSWENRKFKINDNTGEVEESVDGSFNQIPLRLAWAITIHKSQGLTFSHAIIDAAGSFAHGQTYVALSRCRTLEGMVLSAPIPPHAIISDPNVSGFLNTQAATRPDSNALLLMEKHYALSILNSLFDFSTILNDSEDLHRIIADAFQSTYPSVVAEYSKALNTFIEDVVKPSSIFQRQYHSLVFQPDALPKLTERLSAAARYFPNKITDFLLILNHIPKDHDNKIILKRLLKKTAELLDALNIKVHLIGYMSDTPFSPASILKEKAAYLLKQQKKKSLTKTNTKTTPSHSVEKENQPIEIKNKELFNALVRWRKEKAGKQNLPAFRILSTKVLIELSNQQPATHSEFIDIKGCGPKTAQLHADEIIDIINLHRNN